MGKKVAVFAQDNAFGQGNLAAVKAVLGAKGAEVSDILVPEDVTEFTPFARQLTDSKPDLVFAAWAGPPPVECGRHWTSREPSKGTDRHRAWRHRHLRGFGDAGEKISFLTHYFPGAADNEVETVMVKPIEDAGKTADLFSPDGGLPLQVPEGLEDDQIIQAIPGPAAERLEMEISSTQEYRNFWARHPAFANDWSELVENYVDYDPQGTPPHLKASTSYRALAEDTAELHRGSSLLIALDQPARPVQFLQSPPGLMGTEPGLYDPVYVAAWQQWIPALDVALVEGANNYLIVMAEHGAAAVAGFVSTLMANEPLPAAQAEGGRIS
ncbi:ABC transporter substrate-binding protein [Paeniglutamicibacter antarcticus]